MKGVLGGVLGGGERLVVGVGGGLARGDVNAIRDGARDAGDHAAAQFEGGARAVAGGATSMVAGFGKVLGVGGDEGGRPKSGAGGGGGVAGGPK